jgi:uncharacterized MAPEG superfamily protein
MGVEDFGSVEIQMLFLSIVLGLVHLLIITTLSVGQRGLPWGIGSRDDEAAPLNRTGARLERAFRNFLETFPFFLGAVVLAQVLGKHSASSEIGAQLYFWARLLFVPVYALGLIGVRTVVWVVSLIGIILVLLAAWPGI